MLHSTIAQVRFVPEAYDAFGRQRISEPHTIWESKLLFDAAPLLWDDQETAGGGTASSHSTANARVRMSVSANTSGTRVRQTFRHFNYQAGKSQLIMMTFVMDEPAVGIDKKVGYFDETNGVYFHHKGSSFGFGLRNGGASTFIASKNWNIRPGHNIDYSREVPTISPHKLQVLVMDIGWLGGDGVRYGFLIDGQVVFFHEHRVSNLSTAVFMGNPNLPVRYEISNDGTGGASFLDQVCNTVISEGGLQDHGVLRWATLASSVGSGTTSATIGVMGIRLKPTHLNASVDIENTEILSGETEDYDWSLIFNPTVASSSTLTVTSQANSAVQTLTGTSAHTLTGGTVINGGFGQGKDTRLPARSDIKNALRLGASIAGVSDEIWLTYRPHVAGTGFRGGIHWRELT